MLRVSGNSVSGQIEVDIHDCPVVAEPRIWSLMDVEIVNRSKIQNQPLSGEQALSFQITFLLRCRRCP
jgi:hypothetical protein